MKRTLRKLPNRRVADGDRREYPYHGYGQGESRNPENRRIEQRRDWRKNRGRVAPLGSPIHPDDEKDMSEFLGKFR